MRRLPRDWLLVLVAFLSCGTARRLGSSLGPNAVLHLSSQPQTHLLRNHDESDHTRSRSWLALRGGAADVEDEEDDEDNDQDVGLASKSDGTSENSETAEANPLVKGFKALVMPPLKAFAQAPPITRSWVSASFVLALLTSTGRLDARSICMSEPMVVHQGEWWRLLVNFFFMGDALKSIFFYVQLNHFWDCCKMLELVKYRWEPADFIKLIVTNAAMLCVLKKVIFPHTIFLGTPMVMAFLYVYAREYEAQQMNLLGFFSIRCGWLPFAQMLQDLLQAGDVGPNILGLISGHTYHFFSEVKPRLLLQATPSLDDILTLLVQGTPLAVPPEGIPSPETSETSDEESKDEDTENEEANDDADAEADEADEAASSGSSAAAA